MRKRFRIITIIVRLASYAVSSESITIIVFSTLGLKAPSLENNDNAVNRSVR